MGKKNFTKIPGHIRARVHATDMDEVIVAALRHIQPSDIPNYADLGLRLVNGQLQVAQPWLPYPKNGKFSDANVNGREIVRRDLPKIEKTFSWETPNFGDAVTYGTHTHYQTREVYERELIPPKGITMSADLLEARADGSFLVKFTVDQPLSKHSPNFEDDLLYNLNILQENLGTVSLFALQATLEDYKATIRLTWQILPPGQTPEQIVAQMLEGKQPIEAQRRTLMLARVTALAKLEPQCYIAGSDAFIRYFGAKFGDDFVVFENPWYGNALYIMFERWEILAQRSRIDLLRSRREGFERIEHRNGWEERLMHRVNLYRNAQP
jgi:hypothetical protein